MKIKFLLCIFFILWYAKLTAQSNIWYDKNFGSYSDYVLNDYGIELKMPNKVNDLNKYLVPWKIREDKTVGFFYGPFFQIKGKESIVMYPSLPQYFSKEKDSLAKITKLLNQELDKNSTARAGLSDKYLNSSLKNSNDRLNNVFPRSLVTSEIKTALNLFSYYGYPLHDSITFDINEHVTIISGKQAKEMFNADSVFFYNIPLEKPYQKKYIFCTGVVISKQDRATMIFKFFFTVRGKRKEEEYIKILNKNVWYDEGFKHKDE